MKASEIQPRKLVVFDIDDTLVHTQTKVHVTKDDKVIHSLNSHDFTHYRLKPGEEFDFSGFRNAREFFEKSKPIIPMMNQLKRDIATGNKVVMVTARADFDDRELFLDTFRKYGIDMGRVHVYRAGNSKEGTTEERKKAIIKSLLDRGDYTKAIMYDDAKPNLHTFMELKQDHPRTKFYAWHVSLEGEASEYMRESMAETFAHGKVKSRTGTASGAGLWNRHRPDSNFWEEISESNNLARLRVNGIEFLVDPHSLDRVVDRFVLPSDVDRILRKMLSVRDELDRIEPGQQFWVYSPVLDVAVGFRKGQTAALLLKTVLDRKPYESDKPILMIENFADGKNPGRRGLSKRVGIPKKTTLGQLAKIAKSSTGERRRMAQWQLNMRRGKAKANK